MVVGGRPGTLLEREPALDELRAALAEATAGHGRVALVYGEAGIGKTSLVDHFARDGAGTARTLWGACDSLHTPRPLGPLYDIAAQAGPALRERLEARVPPRAIFSAMLEELARRPPVICVLEDLHWADAGTLDLVKFLGRRLHQTPALLVLTYRDDELGPRHPLRVVLGDLATSPALRRVPLSPLSPAAVETLAAGRALDAAALHRQTGGNPFFVTEVLASRDAGIPATVRDAVLARAARLSPAGRAALEAAALAGAQVEPWLLAALVDEAIASTEECVALGALRAQGDGLAFRHELARQAILDTIGPPRRRALHALALRALAAPPAGAPDLARLAHHAEGAGDAAAVLAHAPAAAARAAALGAHREAAAQYARAVRFAAGAPAAERARLLEAYADQAMLVDRLDEATRARDEAIALHRAAGDALREGKARAINAAALVRAGRNPEAEAASRRALAVLRPLPPGPELAYAYRIQSNLRMLDRDRAESVRWGRKAIALAERFGEREIVVAGYNTMGAAELCAGLDRGRRHLERSLALARRAELPEWIAGAFVNLGSASGEIYRFADADRYLTEGIRYATERDLDYSRYYMQAWLALTRLYQGRWAEAGELAGPIADNPHAAVISRIMALVALGRLRTRRGDPGAATVLDEALELAERTRTLQRLGPVRAARAEAAWLAGDLPRARAEARAAWDLARRHAHAWHTGELGFWRRRAGERGRLPAWTARPFARQIAGDWRRAAALWERLGCPYERARALADGDAPAQLAALEIFDRLGARPDLDRLRQRLRAAGTRHIPRGPRATTRAHPSGLTAREAEIVALLAAGLTNARIGTRLHISPKTVDHHVSAILGKLGVATREEAGRVALTSGLARDRAEEGAPANLGRSRAQYGERLPMPPGRRPS
ncbi:MAG TPA: AAA family ATPase [Methylomirabilota bacterium]|jgi:DNA-binding CsgD family transcriptional regulator